MKLIADLRNDILDPTVNLSAILRRAKVLASVLKNEDFRTWVDGEANGYPNDAALPDYRFVSGLPLGTFSGPFGKIVKNVVIPTINLPDVLDPFTKPLEFRDGIRRIESLVNDGGDTLHRPWPAEAIMIARNHVQMSGGCVLVEVSNPIPRADLEAMLDAVRNRLLDLVLKLQDIDPDVLESESALSAIPPDQVRGAVSFTIYGSNNIVAGGGDGFTQTVTQSIPAQDLGSLLDHFRYLDVAEEDVEELERAIEADGDRPKEKFGPKVKKWFGKMVTKSLEGTWKVALDTAPKVLSQALASYYGWTGKA